MPTANVVITNFGAVKLGPMLSAAVDEASADLNSKSRNKKKQAKSELQAIESCVATLATVYWKAGDIMEVTP